MSDKQQDTSNLETQEILQNHGFTDYIKPKRQAKERPNKLRVSINFGYGKAYPKNHKMK